MKKRWLIASVVTAAVVLGVFGTSVFGGPEIHEKQPLVYAPSGEIIELQDRAGFIAANARAESDGTQDVPVYRRADILRDNDVVFFLGRDSGFYRSMSVRFDVFDRIEALFPSTAIRKASDGDHIYVMYDTEKGERLFLFFSQNKNDYRTVDGFPILMVKRLSHDDFAAVKVGDSIDSVGAVDPVIAEYRALFDSGNDTAVENYAKLGAPPTSVHLLTDGVLKIEYARKPGVGYVITKMVFSADFVLEGLDGKTSYRIAEVDYVK